MVINLVPQILAVVYIAQGRPKESYYLVSEITVIIFSMFNVVTLVVIFLATDRLTQIIRACDQCRESRKMMVYHRAVFVVFAIAQLLTVFITDKINTVNSVLLAFSLATDILMYIFFAYLFIEINP